MKQLPKIFRLSWSVLALALAGCESTSFTDRLEAVPPQTQVVEGSVEQVYFAAQKAFKRLDFVLVRSTMGRIEAASAIRTSETFGDSRQTVARVKLAQLEPGRTEVQLSLTQETSSSSMGGSGRRECGSTHFSRRISQLSSRLCRSRRWTARGRKTDFSLAGGGVFRDFPTLSRRS